ncbi:MAG TPA: RidA family protein [Candidatus Sumerlaeota bacterium]|nr:RidA family protein [Candidatus Sumerlaeota bacterium]HOR28857.1 RidA family protein [Candidatus Sumerlaeota bacterium]HPK02805.1 RidA family protein [Candidatus Sumerlaeota bacterium]
MREFGKVVVQNDRAPAPIGPYSQAIKCGEMVFVSGQLGIDPRTGQLAGPDAASQAKVCLDHLQAILEMAGSSLGRVVKTTIFMVDLAEFEAVNKVYAEYFNFEPPARSTIQVAALPKGARVEIEAIAMVTPSSPTEAQAGLGRF